MSEQRPNRYLPLYYSKIQVFYPDESVKELLENRFNKLAEGETSIVIAVSPRRRDYWDHLVKKYHLLNVVEEIVEKKRVVKSSVPKIVDTVNFKLPVAEDKDKN